MAGEPDVVEKLKKGYKAIGRTYKNHIDGFNLLPYLTGKAKESPRKLFFYFSDDGDVLAHALRQLEDRVHGAALPGHHAGLGGAVHAAADAEALQPADRPYEFADITSNTYYDWFLHNAYFIYRGADRGGEVRGDLQGVPAGPEAEQLHHRRRDGEDERGMRAARNP